MKVTLFIGNGFDIGLGLKTRYSDFYRYYLGLKNKNSVIQKWQREISENIQLWSDLENHLRDVAKEVEPDQVNEFLEFIDDLTEELSNYLDGEENKILFNDKMATMDLFYVGLSRIDDVISKNKSLGVNAENGEREITSYTFLNFNYTHSLEKILTTTNKKRARIIHPHGNLKSGIIVGISDLPKPFSIDEYLLSKKDELERWLVKEIVLRNEPLYTRSMQVASETINLSDVICIYGMSLGLSDLMWWNRVAKWLQADKNHRLIVFEHSLNGIKVSRVPRRQAIYRGDPIKERFLSNCGLNLSPNGTTEEASQYRRLHNQIIVVPDQDIFTMKTADYEKLTEEEQEQRIRLRQEFYM